MNNLSTLNKNASRHVMSDVSFLKPVQDDLLYIKHTYCYYCLHNFTFLFGVVFENRVE